MYPITLEQIVIRQIAPQSNEVQDPHLILDLVKRKDKETCEYYRSVILSNLRQKSDNALKELVTKEARVNLLKELVKDSEKKYELASDEYDYYRKMTNYTVMKATEEDCDRARTEQAFARDTLMINKLNLIEAEKDYTNYSEEWEKAKALETEFLDKICNIKMD